MKKNHPNQASAKEKAEGSRENVNTGETETKDKKHAANKPSSDLPGHTDSGPEPDVFGRDIPPQD